MTNPTSALSPQNGFATTLISPVNSTDTTIYLNALPTATEGYLTIDEGLSTQEVLFYNAKGSNFVTVPSLGDRALQGTTTPSPVPTHLSGAVVKMKTAAQYWQALANGYSITSRVTTLSNAYKFSAYKTANQSVTGTQKVQFETEEFDTSSNYDNVTNYRFTAPVAGFYQFSTLLYIESATVTCVPKFYKNGSAFKQIGFVGNSGNGDIATGGSLLVSLAANDYIEVYLSVGSGSKTIAGTADVAISSSYFQGFQVSAT